MQSLFHSMDKRCILVDACNLLHRIPSLSGHLSGGIDYAAESLLADLRPLHDLEHWELHVVVDGQGTRMDQQFIDDLRTLSLIYAPAHLSADSIIESWLLRLGPDWKIRVASEDRTIARTAIANHAEPLSASELLDWLDRVLNRFRHQQDAPPDRSSDSFGNNLEGLL